MINKKKHLFILFLILALSPSLSFSDDSTQHAKSKFSRQFDENPGKYDYQRAPDYYYYPGYDNYHHRNRDYGQRHHFQDNDNQPYFYKNNGNVYFRQPWLEDKDSRHE